MNDQFRVLRDLNPRFLLYTLDPMHVQACKYSSKYYYGLWEEEEEHELMYF